MKASCCPGRGPRSCQEGPCFASPSGFLGADICWRQTGLLPTGSHQPRGPVLSPPEEQLAEACGTLSAEQGPFGEFLLEPHEILLRGVNLRCGNRGPRGVAVPCSRSCGQTSVPGVGKSTHSLICPVTHSFKGHFLRTYCVPCTVLDIKGTTVSQAVTAGNPGGHSAGDPHTNSTPPTQGIRDSFPKEMASERDLEVK